VQDTREIDWRLCVRDADKGTSRFRDARLAGEAARQHGIVTARQLAAWGFSRNAIAVRVRRGHLHPIHRGVYAVGHDALTQAASFTAAVLACGAGAVLSHHSAAVHHGMLTSDGRDPDVTVPRAGGRKVAGIRVHRGRLDPRDVWTRDGIRVTDPARTTFDLAATMSAHRLRRTARQAQAEQRVNVHRLVDVLNRNPGHRGAATLRALIADGPTPTRSDHEDLVLGLIDRAGIDRPEINTKLRLDGRTIEPDLLWREERLVIECDSRRWHSDPLTRENDADKQAILEAHGYLVLRITWKQGIKHPQQTLARIRSHRNVDRSSVRDRGRSPDGCT
jgi:predicted transcriptional regulator of viral defense system